MSSLDSQRIITTSYKSTTVDQIIAEVSISTNTNGFYVFAGQPSSWPGSDSNVAAPTDSPSQFVNLYQNMVFGKKITSADVIPMINRNDWVSGIVYTNYDQDTSNLFDTNFYAVVNSISQYHIFKCLDNNNGTNSIYPPQFSETSAEDEFYQTADGYQWKYMYTIDKNTYDKFTTSDFIPIIPNANVSGNAIPGAIDVIRVQANGAFYNNFLSGQFNNQDIQVGGVSTIYSITNTASSSNGFYNGAYLVLTEGTGKGQFKTIDDYRVIGTAKEVLLDSAFQIVPDTTTQWQISPSVLITGDGKQSSNCFARALINTSSSNSVYAIEILERGQGYSFASANVVASPLAPVANVAFLKVIIPPYGGHGFDPEAELGATRVGFSVTLANSEGNTISTNNDYRTIGILVNPLFSNVEILTLDSTGASGANGTFVANEFVYQVSPITLTGTISINTTSSVIIGTNTKFSTSLSIGDYVICNSGAFVQLAQVSSVANDQAIVVDSNGAFVANGGLISIARITNQGIVTGVATGQLNTTNVAGTYIANSLLIGSNSYATAYVNNYTISGQTKSTTTFNQLSSYIGTLVFGTFTSDELVVQPTTLSNAYFHSIQTVSGVTTMFLYNETGIFNLNESIIGQQSGATFNVTNKYEGDIVPGSGQVIYIENFEPITRNDIESEQIKVVVEY